jgi:hypothetical protein
VFVGGSPGIGDLIDSSRAQIIPISINICVGETYAHTALIAIQTKHLASIATSEDSLERSEFQERTSENTESKLRMYNFSSALTFMQMFASPKTDSLAISNLVCAFLLCASTSAGQCLRGNASNDFSLGL